MISLREIAYARSGDKGNSANVAVFGRTPDAYAWLGKVSRYDVPNLQALNFVLPDILGGGGSRSLRIDAQGKTLGMALLEMQVDAPPFLATLSSFPDQK